MPPITAIPPEILRDRHRLSSQQINALFGRQVIEESFEEKAKALGKVGEFLRITDALASAGIAFVPLKGPLLSFRIYGDATFRTFNDLDILVDSSSLSNIKETLEGFGYNSYGQPWSAGSREQQRILRYGHHISFVHPEKQTAFEIHWKLAPASWLNFRSIDVLSSSFLAQTDFEGRSFTVLNREAELFFLVVHGGHHRWGMLKWLADINMYLMSQEICRMSFTDHVRTLNAGRLVGLCNTMLSQYFPESPLLPGGTKVPGYMVRLSKRTIEKTDYTGPKTVGEIITNIRFVINAYPGAWYKLRVLLSTLNNSVLHGRLSRLHR